MARRRISNKLDNLLTLQDFFCTDSTFKETFVQMSEMKHFITDKKNCFFQALDPCLLNCLSIINEYEKKQMIRLTEIPINHFAVFGNQLISIKSFPKTINLQLKTMIDIKIQDLSNGRPIYALNIETSTSGIHSIRFFNNGQNSHVAICAFEGVLLFSFSESAIFPTIKQKVVFQASNIQGCQIVGDTFYLISDQRLKALDIRNEPIQALQTQSQPKGIKFIPIPNKSISQVKFKKLIKTQNGVAGLTTCFRIALFGQKIIKPIIWRTAISIQDFYLLCEDYSSLTLLIQTNRAFKIVELPKKGDKKGKISKELSLFSSFMPNNEEVSSKIIQTRVLRGNRCLITVKQKYESENKMIEKKVYLTWLFIKGEKDIKVYQLIKAQNQSLSQAIEHFLGETYQKQSRKFKWQKQMEKEQVLKDQTLKRIFEQLKNQ